MAYDPLLGCLIEDIAYIEACRAGPEKLRRKNKKWRKMLEFPHITKCMHLAKEGKLQEYDYVVNSQPMGSLLFHQFCTCSNTHLRKCALFLDEVKSYQLMVEDQRTSAAKLIVQRYISGRTTNKNESEAVDSGVDVWCEEQQIRKCDQTGQDKFADLLSEETLKHLHDNLKGQEQDLFAKCVHDVKKFLKEEPFQNFKESMYYHRYLQWKWQERRPVNENNFYCYRLLGKGGFAEVCSVQNCTSGKLYACKMFNKKRIKKYNRDTMVLNEKMILQKVNSRFVVNLSYAFETSQELCLVITEMRGGDLKFHIYNNICFAENVAKFYAAEITSGLHHLHSKRIVHRDIKPENILMDNKGHVRISDLGLAVEIPEGKAVSGGGGTPGYMAPEVINNEHYTFSPDYFGLGCLIYEMIEGTLPFPVKKQKVKTPEAKKQLYIDALDKEESYSIKFSEGASDICHALLRRPVNTRLGSLLGSHGAKEVMAHPWFSSINWKRLEAGKESPLFVPDPDCVYAKDLFDIRRFSRISGVKFDESDSVLYEKFNTGAVSVSWQEEMIETGVFDELNVFDGWRETWALDLNAKIPEDQEFVGCFDCFKCAFARPKANNSEDKKSELVNVDKVTANEEGTTTAKVSKSPTTVPLQRLGSIRNDLDECKKTVQAVTKACTNLGGKKSLKTNLHRSLTTDIRSTDCSSTKTDYLNSTRLLTSP